MRDSVESVNDGLFHTVELLIQNRSLSLVVDNGAQKSLGKLPRQPSLDHNTQLYIGGEGRRTDRPGLTLLLPSSYLNPLLVSLRPTRSAVTGGGVGSASRA